MHHEFDESKHRFSQEMQSLRQQSEKISTKAAKDVLDSRASAAEIICRIEDQLQNAQKKADRIEKAYNNDLPILRQVFFIIFDH